jgi:hypothetical protein
MPTQKQKDWIDTCKQELDSLYARNIYDLVVPPQGLSKTDGSSVRRPMVIKEPI